MNFFLIFNWIRKAFKQRSWIRLFLNFFKQFQINWEGFLKIARFGLFFFLLLVKVLNILFVNLFGRFFYFILILHVIFIRKLLLLLFLHIMFGLGDSLFALLLYKHFFFSEFPFFTLFFLQVIVRLFLFSFSSGIIFYYKRVFILSILLFFWSYLVLELGFRDGGSFSHLFWGYTNSVSVISNDFLFGLIVKKCSKIDMLFPRLPIFVNFLWFLNLGRLINSYGSLHDYLLDFAFLILIGLQILGDSRRIWINVLLFQNVIKVELITYFLFGICPVSVDLIESIIICFFSASVPKVSK